MSDTPNSLVPRPPVRNAYVALPHYDEPCYGSYGSGYGYPDEGGGPGQGGILAYWRILRRHKGVFLLITFLGGLAGGLSTVPQAPVYKARTSLEIQSLNENFLNMRDVNPNVTPAGSPEYEIQTHVGVLQSKTLIDRVITRLGHRLPVTNDRVSAWCRLLRLSEPVGEEFRRELSYQLAAKNLKVRAQPNTRLIEVLYDSTDPQLAADFANTLTREFIEQNLEGRWQTTQHTGDFLARQMEDLKIKLEKAEESMQGYARTSGLLFTAEKDNVAEQKLRQVQDELGRAQADRVARQSRYELAAAASAETLGEVLDDPALKDIQARLTELRRQLAELTSMLTLANPRVQKVQSQIAALESAREAHRWNILRRIQNDYGAANRREKLLAASYAAQAQLVTSQAEKISHYGILKREVETLRELYDAMLQRVQEAGIASALRASNVRIIDVAQRPRRPYKPNLPVSATLGMLASGFLGVVFVVLRERADRSIQQPGEPGLFLGVPEFGVIPVARPERRMLGATGPPSILRNAALATSRSRDFNITEAFGNVLTSLLFTGENGSRPRVIVLSSANPSEGKTTIAFNLGIALAEIHQRVLLIDADLRTPKLHRIFELDSEVGLSDLLRSATALNGALPTPRGSDAEGPRRQAIGNFVHQTSISKLDVVPSGSGDSAANLLYSPRLAEFLKRAREEYDIVLIDTPPMLTMSDARVVARHADGVIMVVRAHQTTRDAAQLACQRFSEDGTKVLGTILNQWRPRKSDHHGYHYR